MSVTTLDQTTKLSVLISNSFPFVSPKVAAALPGAPQCEVRVLDDELPAAEADVVLSGLEQGVRLLMEYVESRSAGRATAPRSRSEWASRIKVTSRGHLPW